MSEERGEPISYMVLVEGTRVEGRDGGEIGKVKRVLADQGADIFDGLILDTRDGDRFVDAAQVGDLYTRLVILEMTAEEASRLPEPTPSPPGRRPRRGLDRRRRAGRPRPRRGPQGLGPDLRELLTGAGLVPAAGLLELLLALLHRGGVGLGVVRRRRRLVGRVGRGGSGVLGVVHDPDVPAARRGYAGALSNDAQSSMQAWVRCGRHGSASSVSSTAEGRSGRP